MSDRKTPIDKALENVADALNQLAVTVREFQRQEVIARDAHRSRERAGVASPTATLMCRCGHSAQFHHHHGGGHCGECSACGAFFEAYPS